VVIHRGDAKTLRIAKKNAIFAFSRKSGTIAKNDDL
jgi:hypothetical protein